MNVLAWLKRFFERFLEHPLVGPFKPGSLAPNLPQTSSGSPPWYIHTVRIWVTLISAAGAHNVLEIAVQTVRTKFLFIIEKLLVGGIDAAEDTEVERSINRGTALYTVSSTAFSDCC